MESLSTELKAVIARRLQSASRAEVLAIASALTTEEHRTEVRAPAPAVASGSFVKIGKNGEALEQSASDWDAVLDPRTGLMWSRRYAGPRAAWSKAIEQPKALTLAGYSDWQAPSIRQLLSLVDYGRSAPAIDTEFFHVESSDSDWCWTRTPLKSSPGVCAWFVNFSYGYAHWYLQRYEGFVRAVRPSQALDYWLH